MSTTLILGGARSGKSAYAERLAAAIGQPVICIVTARAGDSEMAARIAHHRSRRDPDWHTVEETMALGEAIERHCTSGKVVLVDCLSVWLSNLLFSGNEPFPEVGMVTPPPAFLRERERLLQAIEHATGELIMVANEVGLGVVPMGAVSRWYVDEAGRLNQTVAGRCERVVFVAAGLPLTLKGAAC